MQLLACSGVKCIQGQTDLAENRHQGSPANARVTAPQPLSASASAIQAQPPLTLLFCGAAWACAFLSVSGPLTFIPPLFFFF